jgi:hypothetical protein
MLLFFDGVAIFPLLDSVMQSRHSARLMGIQPTSVEQNDRLRVFEDIRRLLHV